MSTEKFDRILQNRDAAVAKGTRQMWYLLLATEVMDMLAKDLPVTRATLRARLQAEADRATNTLWRTSYAAAVEVLDGPWPTDATPHN